MEIILSALASGLVQWLKHYSPNQWVTLTILAGLSIVISAVYVTFVNVGMWETVYRVLVGAGAIYTFVIQRFE